MYNKLKWQGCVTLALLGELPDVVSPKIAQKCQKTVIFGQTTSGYLPKCDILALWQKHDWQL